MILADQIRGIDWVQRSAEKIGVVSESVMAEVQKYIKSLLWNRCYNLSNMTLLETIRAPKGWRR